MKRWQNAVVGIHIMLHKICSIVTILYAKMCTIYHLKTIEKHYFRTNLFWSLLSTGPTYSGTEKDGTRKLWLQKMLDVLIKVTNLTWSEIQCFTVVIT